MAALAIQDMINRIVAETARAELAAAPFVTLVQNAINDAIIEYQAVRFRFNEATNATPFTFNTVQAQSVYTANDAPWIATMYFIDYVHVEVGNIWTPMSPRKPETVHLDILPNNTSKSFPSEFGYEGNALIFYPVPDQVYPIRVGGHFQLAAPATVNDSTTAWTNDAEELIRNHAKFLLYSTVLRNQGMAPLFDPEDPKSHTARALRRLKKSAAKMQGRSRVEPMRF